MSSFHIVMSSFRISSPIYRLKCCFPSHFHHFRFSSPSTVFHLPSLVPHLPSPDSRLPSPVPCPPSPISCPHLLSPVFRPRLPFSIPSPLISRASIQSRLSSSVSRVLSLALSFRLLRNLERVRALGRRFSPYLSRTRFVFITPAPRQINGALCRT